MRNLVSQNPFMAKGRVLLSISKFSKEQEDVKEQIKIYLNHDVVDDIVLLGVSADSCPFNGP